MPIARAKHWLSIAAACLAIALVVMHPSVTSVGLVLLALGLLCTQKEYWLLARLLSAGTIGLLLPGLISYLLPESWVTIARWETLAAWIYPGSVERFRAPLLMTLALQLSALALLLGHRVRLGAPLLLVMALLLTGLQLFHHHSTFPPLLCYAASWPSLLILGLVLLGQYLSSAPYWRRARFGQPAGSLFWHYCSGNRYTMKRSKICTAKLKRAPGKQQHGSPMKSITI